MVGAAPGAAEPAADVELGVRKFQVGDIAVGRRIPTGIHRTGRGCGELGEIVATRAVHRRKGAGDEQARAVRLQVIDGAGHGRRPGGVHLAVIDAGEIHPEQVRPGEGSCRKGAHRRELAGDIKKISEHERVAHIVDEPDVPHRVFGRGGSQTNQSQPAAVVAVEGIKSPAQHHLPAGERFHGKYDSIQTQVRAGNGNLCRCGNRQSSNQGSHPTQAQQMGKFHRIHHCIESLFVTGKSASPV